MGQRGLKPDEGRFRYRVFQSRWFSGVMFAQWAVREVR